MQLRRRSLAVVVAAGSLVAGLCGTPRAVAQDVKPGAAHSHAPAKLRFDYVGYRAARWETNAVVEREPGRPDRGGLIEVYFTNTSNKPIRLRFYRCDGHDESYWRLGGQMAWDRTFRQEDLAPDATGVTELDAVSKDFEPGQPFTFEWVDDTWTPVGSVTTKLAEDSVQISDVRVLPGMKGIEVHVRHVGNGRADLESLDVLGAQVAKVKWFGQSMDGPAHAIAQVALSAPLKPSQMMIIKLGVKDAAGARFVYAHRRAFEDYFPIGTWSNGPDTYAQLRHMHIDTVVKGGSAKDAFFTKDAKKYGFHVIVPVERPDRLDTLRSLGDNPNVASWMLADEPDWTTTPAVMEYIDHSVKALNHTKPTFLNLCRNVKFFEYAAIPDIPCMDHYCVTAPSSSRWPKPYGTRLEETGYYTRDLKAACEPKPIWVWSQALASWTERPERPVPTKDELAAQLMLNLGRGAKGILWFNYEKAVAKKYPDVRDAMRDWGRVLSLTRNDFLAADPIDAQVVAPPKLDVAVLASSDKLLLCVTNLNYKMDPKGYRFTPAKDVTISLVLPSWIKPVAALAIEPSGVKNYSVELMNGRASVLLGDIPVCRLVVLPNDAKCASTYGAAFTKVIAEEHSVIQESGASK